MPITMTLNRIAHLHFGCLHHPQTYLALRLSLRLPMHPGAISMSVWQRMFHAIYLANQYQKLKFSLSEQPPDITMMIPPSQVDSLLSLTLAARSIWYPRILFLTMTRILCHLPVSASRASDMLAALFALIER